MNDDTLYSFAANTEEDEELAEETKDHDKPLSLDEIKDEELAENEEDEGEAGDDKESDEW